MIEYLRGILLERQADHVVVDVGGVGYGVAVPASTAQTLGDAGSQVALWVRTYVREDILRLYGFKTRHERDVFDIFLGLSGVGPGTGLALLSSLTVAQIIQAAAAGDAARFKKVKGIGQKMAEKLVLELKGRVDRLVAGLPEELAREATAEAAPLSDNARDAVAALEALDVRPQQARRAVVLALEALGEDASVQQLVREGLKHRRATAP
ncbi:MAG TPA: Holliday junction branch migration protein RuvA [Candidatus Sumerlaeota bacterium]|nr:Holliday junction branch migration protein RuvA [Candidatus Sumerlaeota bacterium]HOR26808.1 Holliday junction branch migration protein RuvA [Candidatus Sumerlaeota bacterium]HPK01450.1 Holliday junction branch migration protein RuvA [Candidatus Sumerlaeota bacterium]